MEDWAKRLDAFLEFDEWEILQDGGKVTAKLAKDCAESEFEKFRIVQDPWVPLGATDHNLTTSVRVTCVVMM